MLRRSLWPCSRLSGCSSARAVQRVDARRRALDSLDHQHQRALGVWSTVHTRRGDHAAAVLPRPPGLPRSSTTPRRLTRLPSLLAGTATIPVVYLLGLRTVAAPAALIGAAVVTLSPFTIYYSAEARGYALMILLVALSTLAMLLAVDTRRRALVDRLCRRLVRRDVHALHGGLRARSHSSAGSCGPARRRAGRRSSRTSAAALAFLPWLSGLRADLDSPTTEILSALSPFDLAHVRISLTHATVGYPYPAVGLRQLPGIAALVLFALGVAARARRDRRSRRARRLRTRLAAPDSQGGPRRRARPVGVPLGTALVSLVGTNLFSTRNLAASWPGYALSLGALARGGRPAPALRRHRVRARLPRRRRARPRFQRERAAAELQGAPPTSSTSRPARATSSSTGRAEPRSAQPARRRACGEPHPVVRFGAPVQRDRPFGVFDRVTPARARSSSVAARRARGNRIFVALYGQRRSMERSLLPAGYRLARAAQLPRHPRSFRSQVWEPR